MLRIVHDRTNAWLYTVAYLYSAVDLTEELAINVPYSGRPKTDRPLLEMTADSDPLAVQNSWRLCTLSQIDVCVFLM